MSDSNSVAGCVGSLGSHGSNRSFKIENLYWAELCM